jgi:radical SAM-linked protein
MRAGDWTGGRSLDAPLPWDHLQAGVRKRFLLTEKTRALSGKTTGDCRYGACRQCGVCDTRAGSSLLRVNRIDPAVRTNLNFSARDQSGDSPIPEPPMLTPGKRSAPPRIDEALTARAVRYRIWHRKEDRAAWISQLELQSMLDRAMRRAKLPLAFSQGFHPLPLMSFGRALPVGVGSLAEWFIITLRAFLKPEDVQNRLRPCMPHGMDCYAVDEMPLYGKVESPQAEKFRLAIPSGKRDYCLMAWKTFASASEHVAVRINKQGKAQEVNLRMFLREWAQKEDALVFTLDWTYGYWSPLAFTREIMPALEPPEIALTKLAQAW